MNYARSCDRMTLVRTYTIVVEPDQDGGYFVTVPALPGCFTRGSTIEQCRERAVEAIEVHIAGLQADGEPVPEEVGPPQLLAVTVAAGVQHSAARAGAARCDPPPAWDDAFTATGNYVDAAPYPEDPLRCHNH